MKCIYHMDPLLARQIVNYVSKPPSTDDYSHIVARRVADHHTLSFRASRVKPRKSAVSVHSAEHHAGATPRSAAENIIAASEQSSSSSRHRKANTMLADRPATIRCRRLRPMAVCSTAPVRLRRYRATYRCRHGNAPYPASCFILECASQQLAHSCSRTRQMRSRREFHKP